MRKTVISWRRHELLARLNRVRVRGFEVFESEDELRSLLERAYETPSLWRRVLAAYTEAGGDPAELWGIAMGRNRPLVLTRFPAEGVSEWAARPPSEFGDGDGSEVEREERAAA